MALILVAGLHRWQGYACGLDHYLTVKALTAPCLMRQRRREKALYPPDGARQTSCAGVAWMVGEKEMAAES